MKYRKSIDEKSFMIHSILYVPEITKHDKPPPLLKKFGSGGWLRISAPHLQMVGQKFSYLNCF